MRTYELRETINRHRQASLRYKSYEHTLFVPSFFERKMVTDEVMNQRRYGALPLSYGAALRIAPVGFEPTTPGS